MASWHTQCSTAPRPNFTLIYSRFWLRLRYRPIPIPQSVYDGLPQRAQRLFRLEDIRAPGAGVQDVDAARFYATGE